MKNLITISLLLFTFIIPLAAKDYVKGTFDNEFEKELANYNIENRIHILPKNIEEKENNYILKNVSFLDTRILKKLPITVESIIFNKEAFDLYLKQKSDPNFIIENSNLNSKSNGVIINIDDAKKYLLSLKNDPDNLLTEEDYNNSLEIINMLYDFTELKNIKGDIAINLKSTSEQYYIDLVVDFPKLSYFLINLETIFNAKESKEEGINTLKEIKITKLKLINDIQLNLGKAKKYYKDSELKDLEKQGENIEFIKTYLTAIENDKKYRLEFELLEPVNIGELFNNMMQTIMMSNPEKIEDGTIKAEIDKFFKYNINVKTY